VTGSMVEVDGVSRRFGGTVALDEVSYRAGEAKVYGLVGVNGAGKTTLIKHLLGLLRARSVNPPPNPGNPGAMGRYSHRKAARCAGGCRGQHCGI